MNNIEFISEGARQVIQFLNKQEEEMPGLARQMDSMVEQFGNRVNLLNVGMECTTFENKIITNVIKTMQSASAAGHNSLIIVKVPYWLRDYIVDWAQEERFGIIVEDRNDNMVLTW